MNRYIHPPIHSEAHRRLKADAVRLGHALRREAVNDALDQLAGGFRRWMGRQADWLPMARRLGA